LDFLLIIIIIFLKVCFFICLQVLQILYRLQKQLLVSGTLSRPKTKHRTTSLVCSLFSAAMLTKHPETTTKSSEFGTLRIRNPCKAVPAPVPCRGGAFN